MPDAPITLPFLWPFAELALVYPCPYTGEPKAGHSTPHVSPVLSRGEVHFPFVCHSGTSCYNYIPIFVKKLWHFQEKYNNCIFNTYTLQTIKSSRKQGAIPIFILTEAMREQMHNTRTVHNL